MKDFQLVQHTKRIAIVTIVLSSLVLTTQTEAAKPPMSIVETAVSSGQTNTLVKLLQAADLVEAVSAPGPLTILAPTDDAFAKLPEGALEGLLADPEALAGVLKAHVVAAKAKAETVVTLDQVETLNGTYPVTVTDGVVSIGGATVLATDLMAGNGVVHLIDTVILPE